MKRRTLCKAVRLVLLLGAQHLARGATIVAVRVWPAAEYSRVTIESDALLSFHTELCAQSAAPGGGCARH